MTLQQAMARTDWPLLAQQKLALVEAIGCFYSEDREGLEGLLNWIDAVQDAAEQEGYAVVWLDTDR